MCNLDIPVEESAAGLLEKRDTSLTMPWFVPRAKYPPRRGNVIHPLINGERTFIAVDEALSGAKQTIDVISWGFDPSMRLRMPAGKRVGELLREKARAGVAVRVLIWRNVIADAAENNLPGIGLLGSGGGGAGVGSGVGSTSPRDTKGSKGEGFNEYGSGKGSGSGGVQDGDGEAIAFNRAWFKSPGPGISFRTREFSQIDRIQLGYQHARRHGLIAGAGMQRAAFTAFASHHQKTILVDYETPDDAIGFVMGHNLLRNYWDTDAHEYYNPNRLFFRPWQDLSSRVFGPLLYDLNENFCSAWKSAQPLIGSDQPIPASRLALRDEAFVAPAAKKGGQVMAQITRTHPREGDKSICQSYKLALANARNYVYFENQYFRFTPMAMHLREMRRKLKGAGWKRDLYVFVVTNKPDDHGRMNTFDMLRALGKGSAMPKIERKQQGDESPQARELRKADLQGINVVVCTLCSDTTHVPEPQAIETGRLDDMGFPEYRISEPAARQLYADIYVHSKLLLVDDVFFTLGSANVNERSMENDTELNVAATAPELTREWREKLWTLHTRRGPLGDMGREFKEWERIASNGLIARDRGAPLGAPLIEFFDDSDSGRSTD
jgi:phosphatidylserine/phosphatidylglycerophosphate/cardiolipin synthase-like enzyme